LRTDPAVTIAMTIPVTIEVTVPRIVTPIVTAKRAQKGAKSPFNTAILVLERPRRRVRVTM
jgi:hypothetical protein